MSRFQGDFSYYPTLIFAPAKIEFNNHSSIGVPIEDQFTFAVDANGVLFITPAALSTYTVSRIEKYEWDFGDGELSNEVEPKKTFNFSGVYPVKLSIYSEEFFDIISGKFFRIKNVKTSNIDIGSMTYAWLKQHMTQPHLEALDNSRGFRDLISASSKMFDRMYKDIKEVAELMDVKHVAPKFLEFFSDTLNHQRFYAKKVGYSAQLDNELKQLFLDYDIFDRITKGIAGPDEIEVFRQFILDTAALFKQNGSKQAMENFFKLYDFTVQIREMWTTNFGTTSIGDIVDDFFLDPTLEKTKNKFKFKGIAVTGFDNSVAQFSSGFNNLLIDNYHFLSRHAYPTDATVNPNCTLAFNINDVAPHINNIFRDDGRSLINKLDCIGFDIVTPCASATPETLCTETNILVNPNVSWSISDDVTPGVSYKFWKAPDGYVQSVITTVGSMPNGVDEIAETPEAGDISDDFLWADWKNGVSIPSQIVGVSSLRRPNYSAKYPAINFSSTITDDNLIQVSGTPIKTQHDFFVVGRGFIKITQEGYYSFTLDIGNSGTGDGSQHVALFSLKHSVTYTQEDIKLFKNVDAFSFTRNAAFDVVTVGTTASGQVNLYSRKGEYGIIESRQNELAQTSDSYYLKAGYYAFEVKSTYSSLNSKKLKLIWEAFTVRVDSTSLFFDTIVQKNSVPSYAFFTIESIPENIENNSGKGILTIPNNIVEGADIFTVSYSESNSTNDNLSGIISRDKMFKNLAVNVRFSTVSIPSWQELHNRSLPQRTMMIIFRAINQKKDLYVDVDSYYAVVLNGNKSEISLVEVGYSKELDSPFFRHLNINPNLNEKDKRVFSIQMMNSDGQLIPIEDGNYYDLKIIINDNKVSVLFRENSQFTNAITNVKRSIAQDLIDYSDSTEYKTVISSVSLDQTDADTEIYDSKGNLLDIAEKYEMIDEAGYYGLAVRSSIFKINKFHVSPIDKIDDNKLETIDKWKQIKPKFLDSRNTNLLKYNSYGSTNVEKPISPTFNIEATSSYTGLDNVFTLPSTVGPVDDNAVNKLIANNVTATDWGTRFNVWIDRNFINKRFKSTQDIMDSILIPYGNVFEPFVNWSRVESTSAAYSHSEQAGFTPFINETAHILPHTISMSGGQLDYLSNLYRSDDTSLEARGVFATFLEGTTHSKYLGFWEEVCPLSVSPTWTVAGNTFDNKVFEIIYRNKITKDQVIGVRVLDDKTIDKLICRYCQDDIVWGLFDITVPLSSTSKQPVYTNTAPSNVTVVKYFVPIGKLNKEFVFFLPPAEILRSDAVSINLRGVYAQHSFDGFSLVSPFKSKFEIIVANPWEIEFKSKIKCNYFLDIETSFSDKFTQHNITLDPASSTPCEPGNELGRNKDDTDCVLPNTFYMPKQIVSLFKYMETNSTNFTDDYNYWVPKELWIKRKFDVVYPANTERSVFGGLNVPNKFYNGSVITESQGTNLSLQDGFNADIGKYIVDVSWCSSSVGWDAEFSTPANNTYAVGVFSASAYNGIGFDNSTKFTMGTEKLIPIGNYLNAPVPLASVSLNTVNSLKFGSYLDGEGGPGRSFLPVGLFNWFLTHANAVDDSSATQRAGWEISELNDNFVECVKFNAVYGEIDKSVFKINKYWSFYPTHIPPFGSIVRVAKAGGNCVEVDGTNAPMTSEIIITLGVSDGLSAFYSVPPLIEPYGKWHDQVTRVLVDDYTIPSDQYSVRVNTDTQLAELVLNNQLFNFDKFIGPTHFDVDFFFDKLFPLTTQSTLIDNFDLKREINWITLIEETDHYTIAKRLPDTELKYTANTLPYTIGEYKNNKVFKLVNKFDFTNPSQFSGETTKEIPVGILSNHGSINTIQLTDVESSNYTISCDVIFDKDIVNTDFDKNFELILKAANKFVRDDVEWGITDFYYVGIGTYKFDIALGMRRIDAEGKLQETLLASFGEFNVRNIKADTMYTLKATVTTTEIKVYFNEKSANEQLVLNYNTNKKYEKFTERYLSGEFENLQAIIIGLKELGITYPDHLGDTVSSEYTFKNFKEEFASTLDVDGYYAGFRIFNPMTYVANVTYQANLPKQYKYGATFDGSSFNDILYKIKNRFGIPKNPDVKKVERTLNFSTFVQINDRLFYQFENNDPECYEHPIVTFAIVNDKIIVVEKETPTDSGIGLNDLAVGNFTFIWSLTDNTQNIDSMQDFFGSVPNLTHVKLQRNSIEYNSGLTVSTSGISGDDLMLKVGDTITLTVGGDRKVIWPLAGTLGRYNTFVRVFQEGFTQEYPILIKDKTFYKDGLKSYMNFADKKIKEVLINDNRLHIIFEDN